LLESVEKSYLKLTYPYLMWLVIGDDD